MLIYLDTVIVIFTPLREPRHFGLVLCIAWE